MESQIKCKPLSYILSHVRGKGFPACQWKRYKTHGLWVQPLSLEDPWRRAWQPPPVSLPGESHRQRSLAGYSPWCHKESDMIEVTRHARGKVIPNILHKERGYLCRERLPKDTVTERAIFYFSLRNSEQKMLSHVDLCHLHLSQFLFLK